MRCSVSPAWRASKVCMLRQLAQPLINEARIFTNSSKGFSSPLASTLVEKADQARATSGEAVNGLRRWVMIDPFVGSLRERPGRIGAGFALASNSVYGRSQLATHGAPAR